MKLYKFKRFKTSKMVLRTTDRLEMGSNKEKVKLFTQMGDIMKGNGEITKFLVSEGYSTLPTNLHMRAIGKMDASMVLDLL